MFASESVVYVGQIIGLIAAETREAGVAAVKVVNVDIEVKDALVTIENAKAAKSTHGDDFKSKRDNRKKNNVENVSDDKKTIVGEVTLGGQEHFYFEPHTALAVPNGEKEEMTVYFSTQVEFYYFGIKGHLVTCPKQRRF